MKNLHLVTYLLVIAGALNWGLVGFFDLNVVGEFLGTVPVLENLIYILIGLSAVYELAIHKKWMRNNGESIASKETSIR